MYNDGTTLQDGTHELHVYKVCSCSFLTGQLYVSVSKCFSDVLFFQEALNQHPPPTPRGWPRKGWIELSRIFKG